MFAATAPPEVQGKYRRASIVADEIRIVKHAAAQHNVVFVLGHAHAVLPKDLKVWHLPRRLLLEMPYKVSASPASLGLCPVQHCCCFCSTPQVPGTSQQGLRVKLKPA